MPRDLTHWCAFIPQRVVMCAVCTGVLVICYLQRRIYNMAMRDLVYKEPYINHSYASHCPFMMKADYVDHTKIYWHQDLVRQIVRAFFIPYLIAMVPAGVIADFYGAKFILGLGFMISSVAALLFPILINLGFYYIMLGKVLQGIGQAMIWPSVTVLIAQWAPVSERSTFIGITEIGPFGGRILAYVMTIIYKPLQDSWQAKLYLVGVFGVVWFIVFYLLVYSNPAKCPRISGPERESIYFRTIGINRNSPYPFAPWKAMFQSPPFLSLLVFHFGTRWLYHAITKNLVDYMVNVVHLTQRLTRECYAVACGAAVISSILCGVFSDWLINHDVMTRTVNRKLFGVLGNILTLPLIFAILLVGCDGQAAFSLYTLVFYALGTVYGSSRANCIDMSPQHAGATYGIIHFAGVLSWFFSIDRFKSIQEERYDTSVWVVMYTISACVFVVCSLPYLWFGSAEIQPWNYFYISRRGTHSQSRRTLRVRPSGQRTFQ